MNIIQNNYFMENILPLSQIRYRDPANWIKKNFEIKICFYFLYIDSFQLYITFGFISNNFIQAKIAKNNTLPKKCVTKYK